jgi:hypothetical protein
LAPLKIFIDVLGSVSVKIAIGNLVGHQSTVLPAEGDITRGAAATMADAVTKDAARLGMLVAATSIEPGRVSTPA